MHKCLDFVCRQHGSIKRINRPISINIDVVDVMFVVDVLYGKRVHREAGVITPNAFSEFLGVVGAIEEEIFRTSGGSASG
ncbi:Hypothetical predicted protein [Octopus vulgaris]|uniref:Uncharacterized protein n=1 Tax=Octopus vulgaris TaxID=6645 RepID=A0AA36MIZ5_OCTVU|nr:Hypothetical predicted protein [Octopus vulgaris]